MTGPIVESVNVSLLSSFVIVVFVNGCVVVRVSVILTMMGPVAGFSVSEP